MTTKNINFKDAFINFDTVNSIWSFGSSYFENVLAFDKLRGLRHIYLKDRRNNIVFTPGEKSGIFSLAVNFRKMTGKDFQLKDWEVCRGHKDDLLLVLILTCKSISFLEATLTFRIVPGSTGFQQRISLEAEEGNLTVHELRPYDYTYEINGLQAVAGYMRGCKHQGVTARDEAYIPYEDFELESHELGRVFLKSGRRATEELLPYMILNETQSKAGLFSGVQWSGHWCMDACNFNSAQETKKIVSLSGGPDEFVHTLSVGEKFNSPWCYIGVFKGGVEEGAEAHRNFLIRSVLPIQPWDSLPVTYNHWYAMEEKISEELLYKEAEIAGKVGVEFFIVDAGWYGGSKPEFSSVGDFSMGQGDWTEDRGKFPSGLKAFSDYVHAKGMKFGLWVEPERVDLRTFEEGGWKKEWLTCDEEGKPYEMEGSHCHSGWLCFGVPEVREWVKTWLSKLIDEYCVDWLKWDSNWWTICKSRKHAHQEGDGEYAQIEGLYEVYTYLTEKYPHLIIENCAGGGTRMDTGIMQFSHVHWADDETEPAQKVRCHYLRLSRYMPIPYIYTFASGANNANLNEPGSPDRETREFLCMMDFELRSRMIGTWGLSFKLGGLDKQVVERIKTNIEEYKEIRSVIEEGRFYNLIPVERLARPELKVNGTEAYMFSLDDGSRAVLFVFRNSHNKTDYIKLKGLCNLSEYMVKEIRETSGEAYSGFNLMNTGLPLEKIDESFSKIFLIETIK